MATIFFFLINIKKKRERKRNVSTLKKKKQTSQQTKDGYTGQFCQTFREELTLIFLKLLQKTAEEGNLPNSFCEANHHPDTKTRQTYHTHTHRITGQDH